MTGEITTEALDGQFRKTPEANLAIGLTSLARTASLTRESVSDRETEKASTTGRIEGAKVAAQAGRLLLTIERADDITTKDEVFTFNSRFKASKVTFQMCGVLGFWGTLVVHNSAFLD